MRALADDNVVTHFYYDGNGERVLKLSETWHRLFTNSVASGPDADGSFQTQAHYTLYPNQYMVVRPDGFYTKHYFIGTERIASKIGNPDGYIPGDPTTVNINNPLYANAQRGKLEAHTQENYELLKVIDEDTQPVIQRNPDVDPALGMVNGGDTSEPDVYYFAKDQVGSSSFVADAAGELVQFLAYMPFGETFYDERSTGFATPYRFTGKEQDCEIDHSGDSRTQIFSINKQSEQTGLYYYGARYYDARFGRCRLWI